MPAAMVLYALGALLAHQLAMTNQFRQVDEQGAREEQTQKIDAIVGDEVLGYEGTAHGEHSGQPGDELTGDGLGDRLADNRPEQVK